MAIYKIIVAGCGAMAHVWVDYVKKREDAEIVALVDLKKENAQALADRHALNVPIYTDFTDALNNHSANLVFDITIPASRKKIVTTALRAGCHVFSEKPMAESLTDAKEILSVVRETGKKYFIMQNRRFLKSIRSIQKCLASGTLGTLGSVHADFFLGPHFGGFREEMEHPLILDMAIHTFDQARMMIQADPVSVYCHEYNPPGSWYKGNASATCIFEMNDGTIFTYNGSWCAQGLETSWEAEWRVNGSRGSLRWDGLDQMDCEILKKDEKFKKVDVPIVWEGAEQHVGGLDHMFDALLENRLAETDSTDNFHSIAMVLGAIESAKTGKRIDLRNDL